MLISKGGDSKAWLENCFFRNCKTATPVFCVDFVAKSHICLMTTGRAGGDNGKRTLDFSLSSGPGQAEMDTSGVYCSTDPQWHRVLWHLAHPLLA